MRIVKNIVLTLLFIVFSCSHGVFNKPLSGLMKDYDEVIFDSHRYYYVEEFPIDLNLKFEFVDTKSEFTSRTDHQALGSHYISTRKSVYESSSDKTNSFSFGKVGLLVDSVYLGKLGIKTIKGLNEHLKNKKLDSLGVKFVFDSGLDRLSSMSNRNLLGSQCIVFDYNELINYMDIIKNKKNNVNLTLNLANKDLQNSKYRLFSKTYNKYIDIENKFLNCEGQNNSDFHFKIKGNIGSLLSVLEEILKKVKKGKL
ncbi:hypothetical protein BOFE_10770 (plasmid) [Candidatus Borrelia fainii]|uniref:Lipoprotein n=1 Tax=Candidatus Borrelia fainii TaxID=2518322 RepID=A0ABN6UT06_9SPIR|nr:hypothetical protein [Candidatus Borrelia fainii]BDU63537.1 hypothetical protein BOFE_10770 [Candidatus Borrelia fainii]